MKKQHKAPGDAEQKAREEFWLDLNKIVSNTCNPRDSVPLLASMGYGLWTVPEGGDKPSLFSLALSQDAAQQKEFCDLLEKFGGSEMLADAATRNREIQKAGHICAMAHDLTINSQIHAASVRTVEGGYDLVDGARRALAAAYAAIKYNVPPRLLCVLRDDLSDDGKASHLAFSANVHVKGMTPGEQAEYFTRLKNMGLSVKDIETKVGVDHQTIRGRLAIKEGLKEAEFEEFKRGDLSYVKALEIVKKRKEGDTTTTTASARKKKDRDRIPSRKDFEEMYYSRSDLSETIREFIATEVLHVKYMNKKDTAEFLKNKAEKEAKSRKKASAAAK